MLLGSSLIRDIDPDKLKDTSVICKRGGTIKTIQDEVQGLSRGYNNITLVVGGNDCDNQPTSCPTDIVSNYHNLAKMSLSKCKTLTVSSVCPRLTSDVTQTQIDNGNVGLMFMCEDMDKVTYVDNSPSFKLGDGTINDGYFTADGVHITRAGVNKLAKNLNLRTRNPAEEACRDRNRPKSPSPVTETTSKAG